VLDSREKPILDLTHAGQPNKTNSSVFVEGDPTALSYLVQLPKNLECRDCTIRLIRQASEWGKSYMFWSCADVDIIPRKSIELKKKNRPSHIRLTKLAVRSGISRNLFGSRQRHCGTLSLQPALFGTPLPIPGRMQRRQGLRTSWQVRQSGSHHPPQEAVLLRDGLVWTPMQ
jgi:hypothetical protein